MRKTATNLPHELKASPRPQAAQPNDLEITYLAVGKIREFADHPRVHSKKAVAKAKQLLAAHGQIVPVVVDATGEILDGVLRYRALCELGYDEIRVVVVTNRDPATLKAIRLALNRLPQDAKWDDEKLRSEFAALIELDYDLNLTGFEAAEFDMAFSIDEPAPKAIEAEAAEDLEPVTEPATKAGDVWHLGRHILACGDARDHALLARLMGDVKASAAIVDFPYNVPIGGFVSGLGKKVHKDFAMASGEMSGAQFTDFLAAGIDALKTALAPGAICFFFMDWRHAGELIDAARRCDLVPMNLCVWVKTNPGMGTFYRSAHELCFVYKHGDAAHINNFELGQHGRSRSNVWTYAGMNVFGKDRTDLLKAHPTVKPQPLLIDMIKDVTKRGQTVIDTFVGSGSTILAAEETGRTCIGVELDAGYADVAIQRWQKRAGKDAIHSVTGHAFDDLASKTEAFVETDVSLLDEAPATKNCDDEVANG